MKPSNSEKSPSPSYWMKVPFLKGNTTDLPKNASIAIIGSGLTGVSAGYFLNQRGFKNVAILDYQTEEAASFRNCGHILNGTVESMKAMSEIHGPEKARELWAFSTEICDLVGQTIEDLQIDADYRQDGYLVIAISEVEDQECRESVELLSKSGFQSEYVEAETVRKLGFKNCFGARYEKGSAHAHPVKFRNGVLQAFLKTGGRYYSNVQVQDLHDTADGVEIRTARGPIQCDAVVIAANAYSPLFSDFFRSRRLLEPFRGQILTSRPLKHPFQVRYPHSFDHGYEYALVTPDNRLMLGGWRNHSSTGEVGTYSLQVNPFIENGLKEFAQEHYSIDEEIEWEYSWSGIMAASKTGLPFIGNTTSPQIYCCAAYTGHGFSWAHGSARLLADIIAGEPLPKVSRYFNPKVIL